MVLVSADAGRAVTVPAQGVVQGRRTAAYHALVRGILTVERRIAPWWTVDPIALSQRERVLRDRVTANCLRELDVLLDHWAGNGTLGNGDPGAPDPGGPDADTMEAVVGRAPAGYLPAEIVAIAATYWAAAHAPAAMHRCNLLT